MKLFRFIACLSAVAVLLSGCSGGRVKKAKGVEGEVVEAEGTAPYNTSDLAGTKAAALASAQRAAVELVVGVYVTAKTRVDKAVAIENSILTKTGGYVKRYEVLKEGRDGDWYKMRIRALVSTQQIHEQLESMGLLRQAGVGFPRVTVALHEYVGEREGAGNAATNALIGVMLKQGYKVVDLPKPINADEDAVEAARKISHSSAELLIAGLARAQSLGHGKEFGGMASYRASVNFRVIETGTGEVMSTVSQTASGIEATPEIAAEKALKAAAELAARDLATLPEELAKRSHVVVIISGLKSFETLAKLQKDLTGQRGVKELYLRSYSQEAGIANLDVLTDQLDPQELADRCVRSGGSTWSVFQVTGRTVQISASLAGR